MGAIEPVRRQAAASVRVVCSCRRVFDWRAAPLVGYQETELERLELRNCTYCGSTRALVVSSKLRAWESWLRVAMCRDGLLRRDLAALAELRVSLALGKPPLRSSVATLRRVVDRSGDVETAREGAELLAWLESKPAA